MVVRDIERIVMGYLFGKSSLKGYMVDHEVRGDNNYVLASVFPNTAAMEETIKYGRKSKTNKKNKLTTGSKRKTANGIEIMSNKPIRAFKKSIEKP